jgi:hypothetical protein
MGLVPAPPKSDGWNLIELVVEFAMFASAPALFSFVAVNAISSRKSCVALELAFQPRGLMYSTERSVVPPHL